jgi:aspartyl aminopeptidase
VQALIDCTTDESTLADEAGVRAVALFDHEEVGSSSAIGAGGPLMRDAIVRVSRSLSEGEDDATERCLQKSFLVSADMAHGLHPNYAEKHEPDHQPAFHKCVSTFALMIVVFVLYNFAAVIVACTLSSFHFLV